MKKSNTKTPKQTKAKKKWVKPKPYPLAKQEILKEEIRRNYLTKTKTEIVRHLVEKYNTPQRTAYNYIDKVIKEDIQNINRENVLEEVLSSKAFRKRQILGIWQRMNDRETKAQKLYDVEMKKDKDKRDRSKMHLIEYSPMVRLALLRQLAEEDKTAVNILQELSYIEKPKEKFEIEQRNYTFSIELKKFDMMTPEMFKDDNKTEDKLGSNAKTVESIPNSTGQNNN